MKVLVLGGSGMLGHKLVQRWSGEFDVWTTLRGGFEQYEHFGIFRKDRTIENLNVEDSEALARAVEDVSPDVIFNAIGVVKQVPTAKDAVVTLELNSVLPHRLAEISERLGARLITISTDCVFDGVRGNFAEADLPNATDLYGKSKHLGEVVTGNALTIRTSIIGRELGTSHSLVEWFLSNRGKTIKGFTNAIYSGFPTIVFADIVTELIKKPPSLSGLYHVSSDPINKFDLLTLLRDEYKVNIDIEAFDDFRIDRSLDSKSFRSETGFAPEAWPDMVRKMVADATPYDSFAK